MSSLLFLNRQAISRISSYLDIAGCNAWYDGDDQAQVDVISTINVNKWQDKSPEGAVANDDGAGSMNQYSASITVNGRRAISPLGNGLTLAGGFDSGTLIVVAKGFNNSSSGIFLGGTEGGSLYFGIQGGKLFFSDTVGGSDTVSSAENLSTIGSQHIYTIQPQGTGGVKMWQDSTLIYSDTTSNVTISAGTLFSDGGGVTTPFQNRICEIVSYDHQITSGELARAWAFAKAKWGTP